MYVRQKGKHNIHHTDSLLVFNGNVNNFIFFIEIHGNKNIWGLNSIEG